MPCRLQIQIMSFRNSQMLKKPGIFHDFQQLLERNIELRSSALRIRIRPIRSSTVIQVNRLSAQHLQATTTPRKRVVLDYYPGTKEIATKFSLRNNSNFAVAFKVLSSFEIGYVAKPGLGIVQPGEAFDVTITVNDLQSAGRELEKDKFTIDLASVDSDQTSADNVAYEERRILFVGMSPAAKERLVYVAAEQRRNLQLEKLRSDRRRLLTYVGTGLLGLLGVVVLFVDFCALSSGNLYNEGGLKPAGG